MWTDMEKQQLLEAVDRIESQLEQLDDAVFGDERQGRDGLIRDMKVVHAFILKWDKREYTVRAIILLLSSNLILTLLTLALTFLVK
jgi:hypothetical protein